MGDIFSNHMFIQEILQFYIFNNPIDLLDAVPNEMSGKGELVNITL